VWRLDHVFLQVGVEAVLRAEERRQRPVATAKKAFGGVYETAVN
jgi:hypothetical protein